MKRKLDANTTLEDLLQGWTRCQFFLTQKQRLCRMDILPGSKYCGNHQPLNVSPATTEVSLTTSDVQVSEGEVHVGKKARRLAARGERIPCPLDPSHNIFRNNLESHLRICNETKKTTEYASWPYFCQDCNSGNEPGLPSTSTSDEDVDPEELLLKLRRIYASIECEVPSGPSPLIAEDGSLERAATAIRECVCVAQTSFAQRRHVDQDICIVQHMLTGGVLTGTGKRVVCLEFGAGKGLLSLAVSAAAPQCSIGLIERASNRRKVDRLLTERGVHWQRYRMDIRHCLVSALPLLSPSETRDEVREEVHEEVRTVVIAKHLCGLATDLALRALVRRAAAGEACLALAPCCHHACSFNDYVNTDWLREQGLDRAAFDVLRLWTGWASLDRSAGRRAAAATAADEEVREEVQQQQGEEEEEDAGDEHAGAANTSVARPQSLGADVSALARAGRMAKRVLDHGRLLFLRAQLPAQQCRVLQYCDAALSPECMLLLVTPPSA